MSIPIDEILRKLDTDFFAGRWAKVTDRQRRLLEVIAQLDQIFTCHIARVNREFLKASLFSKERRQI